MKKSSTKPGYAESDGPEAPDREIVSEEKAKQKERSRLAQEEAAIETKIVELIMDGQWQSLRPNSGTSVEIRGSHVCVDYHEETGYRVWEWHGHCMIYSDGEGYTPEYMYGNYFEPLVQEEEVSRPVGLGLATAMSRRVMPGLGGVINPLERPGLLPMRSIDGFRRPSS